MSEGTADGGRQTAAQIVDELLRDRVRPDQLLIGVDWARSLMIEAAERAAKEAISQQMSVLRLRPGDLLVVHAANMPLASMERMAEHWRAIARQLYAHAVVVSGVEGFSVIRPEQGDE